MMVSASNTGLPVHLTSPQANALAATVVANLTEAGDAHLVDELKIERDAGWVFFYAEGSDFGHFLITRLGEVFLPAATLPMNRLAEAISSEGSARWWDRILAWVWHPMSHSESRLCDCLVGELSSAQPDLFLATLTGDGADIFRKLCRDNGIWWTRRSESLVQDSRLAGCGEGVVAVGCDGGAFEQTVGRNESDVSGSILSLYAAVLESAESIRDYVEQGRGSREELND